ncbi:MAG: hypothetical protein ACYTGH_09180 [Planctomycetota bacterium]|jgi:hypothetical protein
MAKSKKEKTDVGAIVAEAAANAGGEAEGGASAKKGGKNDKSIEHIRELLVGKLARAIRKQLDEARSESERRDQELGKQVGDVDRRQAQQNEETRTTLAKQMEETSDRVSKKFETLTASMQSKDEELDNRLSNTAAALDNAEKRLRNEINARSEDVASQGKETATKLATDLKSKTSELSGQLNTQRDEINEQLVEVRRTIDVRGRQFKDELNAFVLGTADGLRKSIDGLAAAFETDKTDMRAYNDKRFSEVLTSIKDVEKRLGSEIEEQVSELSTRLLKRIETAESVFTARTSEIENQVDSLRSQLEEKNRHLQSMVETSESDLRSSIAQAATDTQTYAREAKEELERKLVYREDIGNKLIEMGMRLTKDITSGDIVQAIEDGSTDYGELDELAMGDEDVTSVDDILNLMGGADDDDAAPPPSKSAADMATSN